MKTTKYNKRKMVKKKVKKRSSVYNSIFWKEPKRIKNVKSIVPVKFFSVKPISRSKAKNAIPRISSRNTGKMKLFTPVKIKPMNYAIKESIDQKRKLSPWGDADLDGSPNKFDCNPRNAAEDGVFARALGMLTGGKYGQSSDEYQKEKSEKRISKISLQAATMRKEENEAFAARKELRILADTRIKEIAKSEGITFTDKQKTQLRREADKLLAKKQYKYREKYGTPTPTTTQKVVGAIQSVGSAPIRAISAVVNAPQRELAAIDRDIEILRERGEPTHKLRARRNELIKRRKDKSKQMVGGILSAVTPLGDVPEIQKLSTAGKKTSKTEGERKQGRGRPTGGFKKYQVDGQFLSEAKFQQIRSVENKKRKSMGMPKIPIGSYNLTTVKQTVPQQEVRQTVPQQETIPEGSYTQPQQPQQLQAPQGSVLQQQMQEQIDDNILKAPNVNKGELVQTAGIFQDDPQYNILNAPNFQQGALRNVGQTEETPAVQLGERPNANPYEDEYTDIDPGSGRTIVQRRPNEKWATGEAL